MSEVKIMLYNQENYFFLNLGLMQTLSSICDFRC